MERRTLTIFFIIVGGEPQGQLVTIHQQEAYISTEVVITEEEISIGHIKSGEGEEETMFYVII